MSSIVGYVLGIGDRHAHNILVHQRTAEVVHIDFGVTFEQGKALSTPETVPFRLTRFVFGQFLLGCCFFFSPLRFVLFCSRNTTRAPVGPARPTPPCCGLTAVTCFGTQCAPLYIRRLFYLYL